MRRRTSARFFPKKGRSVRLDVGEWAVALNIREELGSLKPNPSSKKPFGTTPNGFIFQAAAGGFAKVSGCLLHPRHPIFNPPQQRWFRQAHFIHQQRGVAVFGNNVGDAAQQRGFQAA